jgi:hypothetical protein
MRGRFGHAGHVVRVALVFAVGALAFLIVRHALVPSDFGKYGFYRAGALDDARARPIKYAGSKACDECHAGTYEPDDDAKPAKAKADLDPVDLLTDNKHRQLRCEACHGPLAAHIDDLDKPVAKVANDKLCLGCHREITGRPKSQPQVVFGDHGDKDPCVSCHRPHRPRTDEEKG